MNLTIFEQIGLGLCVAVILISILYPYYTIPDIHKSIDKLTEEVEKLRKTLEKEKK